MGTSTQSGMYTAPSELILPLCAIALTHLACCVQDPSIEDRQAALFNSTCVHASFGDVEFAQVTLRGIP